MIKRAAIYARVSLDIQRDNYSIASQVAGCIDYANKHGYTVIGNQFVDPQTGLELKARKWGDSGLCRRFLVPRDITPRLGRGFEFS